MKKWLNGNIIDMTPEEIAAMEAEAARYEAAERRRPLTESEVSRMLIAQQINTLEVDDATALRMLDYYPAWQAGQDYPVGYKTRHGGKLCRCLQAHASQAGWEPGSAPVLWEYIDETHTGERYDPIPYEGNMELTEGLYYIQDGVVYRCTRSSGQPVHNPLSELVWIYVEVVET